MIARLRALSKLIDRVNGGLGRAVSWLSLVMVFVGAGNALLRYCGRFVGHNLSSNAALEAQWYLFSAMFLLAAAWTLQQDRHVRVDVLYGRLSPRGRAWIDVLGTCLFLLPFCIFAVWVSFPSVAESWRLLEQSPDPGGLPRYPVKTLLLVALWTLIAQGISQLIKHGLVALALVGDEP
ncbi:MAG: TRAP transporter small permease subunit [Oligoflexia bacterium]|nr:TRAP transporter small permease subunit [Oligoflexia bacterium]